MSNQATLQENWTAIKEKLLAKWKELTDDDLDASKGDFQQLVATIQRKTGDATESVEKFFGQILSSGNAAFHRGGESIQDGAQNANTSIRKTYAGLEDAIRHRPASSVAIGLAVGLLAGLTLSFLIPRK